MGNRVSKTRFQVGVFSKLTPLTQIRHSPLSITLSLTQSRQSHALTLTLNLSLSHSLFSHSISTISHSSPSPKDLIKPQQGVQSFKFLQSTRSLKTIKKKVSRFVQSSLFGCRETVGKIKETLVSPSFFLFWFIYWISNRTVKKDRNYIVFWDWIGLWVWIFFFFFGFCFALCSVRGLISSKFQISILNYALFYSDDVRVC